MDFIVFLMPLVMYFVGMLSERIRSRKQVALEIGSHCQADIKGLISSIKTEDGTADIPEALPKIHITIVNTGRVIVTVQALKMNWTKRPSYEGTILEKIILKPLLAPLLKKIRLKRISKWLGRKTMLKMTETKESFYFTFLQHGKMLTLAPGESKVHYIPKEGIIQALEFLATMKILDSEEDFAMIYPSCRLVGEEKIRRGIPIFYSLVGPGRNLPIAFWPRL